MTDLTAAVRTILEAVPDSLRTVATHTGVSHALIADIRAGKRNATEAVARKLLAALVALRTERANDAAQYRTLVTTLRKALPKGGR